MRVVARFVYRVNIHETRVHQFTVMPTTMYMFDSLMSLDIEGL